MKRSTWIAWPIAALATLLWWASGYYPPLGARPATARDCVIIRVWNNGWHTSLSLSADQLDPTHPIRQLFPSARYFLIGWGDAAFYQSDGQNLWLGAGALLPGGATTIHVLGAERPPEEVFNPKDMIHVAVSRAGLGAINTRLRDSLDLDANGAAQILAPGQVAGASFFLRARHGFHLFQVCNHWTARTLRAGGVRLNAAAIYTGDQLKGAVRAAGVENCPPVTDVSR
jgi:uncharacterized protein (TIGR02117 family)